MTTPRQGQPLKQVIRDFNAQVDRLLPPPTPERDGNQVQLLLGGGEYFPLALQAIEQASELVQMETYIFANDATGRAFAEALADAAMRGVNVQLVLDGFGGQEGIKTLVPGLRAAGVSVRVFRPERWKLKPSPRRLRRMHRKMLTVDGQVAFVGGINVLDDMNHSGERGELLPVEGHTQVNSDLVNHPLGPRYDFAVQLHGPVVMDVQHAMQWLWMQIGPGGMVTDTLTSAWWRERAEQWVQLLAAQSEQAPPRPVGEVRVQLALRDNFRLRRRIERAYIQAIGKAHTSVILANAYFLPGRKMRNAIAGARHRGVVVKLLLQGRVEYKLQHYATQHLYHHLLAQGVEVYEYLPGFLHAKVGVVDSFWATVGSSNLDPLSCLFAREANVLVQHRPFAQQLKAELVRAMEQHSRRVLLQSHAARPWRERAFSWLCYKLMVLAVFVGGFGSRY
ncbi:phosphatidylserine/phosphatidylglycerophosphate/cardiolipin synthase family protein [Limnobacter sp.]|uniref:phospholipase D-like domain-containing protein n=1 Tax=Limnobacter sp. TaxID=2003368 RepID=UPI0035176ACE